MIPKKINLGLLFRRKGKVSSLKVLTGSLQNFFARTLHHFLQYEMSEQLLAFLILSILMLQKK
jgi:hypothetical protein